MDILVGWKWHWFRSMLFTSMVWRKGYERVALAVWWLVRSRCVRRRDMLVWWGRVWYRVTRRFTSFPWSKGVTRIAIMMHSVLKDRIVSVEMQCSLGSLWTPLRTPNYCAFSHRTLRSIASWEKGTQETRNYRPESLAHGNDERWAESFVAKKRLSYTVFYLNLANLSISCL